MNSQVLKAVAAAIVIMIGFSWFLNRGPGKMKPLAQQTQGAVKQETTFAVQPSRKLDYGFKHKVNDCLTDGSDQWIVVDVDNNATYVLAPAQRFFKGPHPLTENDLKKVAATELDQKSSVSKVECSTLQN